MIKEPENRNVTLPAELYDRIGKRVKDAGFNSVDEYVVFVLEEILREEVEEEVVINHGDEEEVRKRLKSLGYLD